MEGTILSELQNRTGAAVDDRNRMYLLPRRVVWKQGRVDGAEALLRDRPGQIALDVEQVCILAHEGETASVVLDFGREIHGGLELSVFAVDGNDEKAELRLRFGESLMEAMSELGGPTNATNDHARRDFTMMVERLSMNPVGETGFRFVRIDLLIPGVRLQLNTVKAVLVYRDIPYLGSFRCSDPVLERIWDTCAYTVHLCMQHYIWDGIKRDRLVWIGDLHPEIMAIQTVFGNNPLIRESLDFAAAQTPKNSWMNGIPAYSMWWIIIQRDYFRQFGDREYLQKQLPYLKETCRILSGYIDPDGRDTTPEMRFVDWPSRDNEDAVNVGLQALHILATRSAIDIFETFGEAQWTGRCREDLQKLLSCPVQLTGVKQCDALAVWAGLIDPVQANLESLKPGGAAGMSTFMGSYILQARAMAGDVSGALDALKEYWGGMLKLGATTFWEDFDIRWMEKAAHIDRFPAPGEVDVHGSYGGYCYVGYRHSLCHGWSSGAATWLTRYILGVEVLEPGCRRLRITPNLCGLSWAEGSYPTPFGVVQIRHSMRTDGSVETDVQAPEGVTWELGI